MVCALYVPWLGLTMTVIHARYLQYICFPYCSQFITVTHKRLSQVGNRIEEVASNAAKISTAMSIDQHSSESQSFCLCHLQNIDVKRAISNPQDIPAKANPCFDWSICPLLSTFCEKAKEQN